MTMRHSIPFILHDLHCSLAPEVRTAGRKNRWPRRRTQTEPRTQATCSSSNRRTGPWRSSGASKGRTGVGTHTASSATLSPPSPRCASRPRGNSTPSQSQATGTRRGHVLLPGNRDTPRPRASSGTPSPHRIATRSPTALGLTRFDFG